MTIKQKLAVSGAWSIVAAVFNNLSTIIIFVALARLLTPEQFGIVAYATVFVELSRTLVQGGIPDALIQRSEWDERSEERRVGRECASTFRFVGWPEH